MSEVHLEISGMTCAACSARIEKLLSKTEGVIKANVNLAMESAKIEFDSKHISPSSLMEKIGNIGYGARLETTIEDMIERRKREEKKILYRFLGTLPFALPLMLAMFFHGQHYFHISILTIPLVGFLLATPVQFVFGFHFYKNAFKALKQKSSDMNVLVALGTSAAYGYSVYLAFGWGWLKSGAMLYFETSAMLISLISLGKWLETRAKGKSVSAISALLSLQPQRAFRKTGENWEEVSVEIINPDDVLLVKPGGKIPVDGKVVAGSSYVDESLLTGESMGVIKKAGAGVLAGSVNGEGVLEIQAVKIGKQTMLSQMAKKVKEVSESKAPIQRVADKISAVFVPVVLGISILVFAGWYFLMGSGFAAALENTIAVLVIACPCALGLATPVSIMLGGEIAAKHGILFKSGEYLELAHRTDALVLDKTGTLTYGSGRSVNYIGLIEKKEFLGYVWNLEQYSEHPLAAQILSSIPKEDITKMDVQNYKAIPGKGIEGQIQGITYCLGKKSWMETMGVSAPPGVEGLEGASVYVWKKKELLGAITLEEQVKPEAERTLRQIEKLGVQIHLLTGDNEERAKALAKKIGIHNLKWGVTPHEKLEYVNDLKGRRFVVAMAGDGVNDSLALSAADVGIAMGDGTDVALEAAAVTLLKGDLRGILKMLAISRACFRNIRQNFFWALAYNCLGIPLAAFGKLSPWVAGAAMSLSSVSVVLNALRLKKLKLN